MTKEPEPKQRFKAVPIVTDPRIAARSDGAGIADDDPASSTIPSVNSALEETGTGDDATAVDSVSEGTEPPTRPAPLSYIRGMGPRAVIAWVRNTRGEMGLRALADALPEHVLEDMGGRELRPSLMGWVPFLSHCELLAQVERLYGTGDGSTVLQEVGRAAAYRDMPSIAKPFARLLSPGFLVDTVTKIWRVYHSTGSWEVTRGERDLLAILVGRPENHPAFCPVVIGYCEAAMTIAGATEVRVVEERCANKGSPVCSLRMQWVEKSDSLRARDRVPRAPS